MSYFGDFWSDDSRSILRLWRGPRTRIFLHVEVVYFGSELDARRLSRSYFAGVPCVKPTTLEGAAVLAFGVCITFSGRSAAIGRRSWTASTKAAKTTAPRIPIATHIVFRLVSGSSLME